MAVEDGPALAEAAAEALRVATIDPRRARTLAARARAAARDGGDHASESVAAYASGVAEQQLGDATAAIGQFRTAIRAGDRAHRPDLTAQARASLAGSLCVRGWPRRGLTEIGLAIGDLTGVAQARARSQRSAILQLLGRFDEALDELKLAIPQLRRAGDADWATAALSNRSLLHLRRRSFAAAEADLLTAQQLSIANNLDVWAGYIEQNLAALTAGRGEIVDTLRHLALAEKRFRDIGRESGSLAVDRGETLLSVRLIEEARAAAESAVRIHIAQGDKLEIPDAQLLLSTVALVQGDLQTAQSVARQALQGFRRLDHAGGIALARYALLQARYAGQPESVSAAAARRSADELGAAGWVVPALEARVLAGTIELRHNRREPARRDLLLASRVRSTGPADARVRGWLAEAMLRRADGRRTAAIRAVDAGLRVLDGQQASLGATELRAHITHHRGALAGLGLTLALEAGDARRVLAFVERYRATALLFRPPRPPDDPELSKNLADLRVTMREIEQRREEGLSTAGLVQRQVRLERAVSQRARELPGRAAVPRRLSGRFGELVAALDDTVLIEFVELEKVLHVVTVADGRCVLRALGPVDAVVDRLPHLSFVLRRLANPRTTDASRSAATVVLRRIQQVLQETMFAPLTGLLADRPAAIVPSVSLQGLPWSVVPALAGRPVSIVPSATLWLDASARSRPDQERVVVAAGPGLPGAREEALAVSAVHRAGTTLLDGDATASAVAAAVDGASLAHIAAHGRLRSDNPYFSSLVLADGPLTVYDLERINEAPHHVVLAACDTARSKVISVDEVLGLAAALLAQGTASLVAPVVSIVDEAVVPFMRAYHQELRRGRPPAAALAEIQQHAAADGLDAWASAAGFLCMGVGRVPVVGAGVVGAQGG